ncbi:leucyl aminopeptidase [candidate division WOR-3 bacterium]|nr:leucyl aminopeptidase [candidate division WOR-3 bacterium]
MKVGVKQSDVTNFTTPLLVVNLFKDVKVPGGATGAVDKAIGGEISKALEAGEMHGKLGETLLFRTEDKIPAERVLVIGLGEPSKFGPEEIRRASASAVWAAERLGIKQMATIVHGAGIGGINPQVAAEATTLGSLLASYRFDKYKSDKERLKPGVENLIILERDGNNLDSIEAGVHHAEPIAWAQNFARDLVNEPSNVMTPVEFAARVEEVGENTGLDVKVYDEGWIQDKGMNLMWGVAKGSDLPPRLLVIRHQGAGKADPWLGIIGKGVMFDSGGISLKRSEGMGGMKGDMGGGAAVVGALLAAAKLSIEKNVLGIVPAVVNSPGGRAMNPGDIIKGLDGPTVEIISTDAEGRLIMADALSYARELGATYLIDIATLTGASVVALGNKVAALFATEDKMQRLFLDNVAQTGEKLWPMPLFDEYAELLKSTAAGVKNSTGRDAGCITAAKFLERFVDKKPWAHLDIASKESTDKPYSCYRKGATGFGVRTLLRFIEDWEPN